MKTLRRMIRKSYAMKRMALAIERAIQIDNFADQKRAARWAAAWGLLCGINSNAVRLRSSEVQEPLQDNQRRDSDRPANTGVPGAAPICLNQPGAASITLPPSLAAMPNHPMLPECSAGHCAAAAPPQHAHALAALDQAAAAPPAQALAGLAATLDEIPAAAALPGQGRV